VFQFAKHQRGKPTSSSTPPSTRNASTCSNPHPALEPPKTEWKAEKVVSAQSSHEQEEPLRDTLTQWTPPELKRADSLLECVSSVCSHNASLPQHPTRSTRTNSAKLLARLLQATGNCVPSTGFSWLRPDSDVITQLAEELKTIHKVKPRCVKGHQDAMKRKHLTLPETRNIEADADTSMMSGNSTATNATNSTKAKHPSNAPTESMDEPTHAALPSLRCH
jgi:hypothetical protein